MKVLVTGADGFVGKNLRIAMSERRHVEVLPVTRSTTTAEFAMTVSTADAVIHLAGVNRPQDPAEFLTGNLEFTAYLCESLQAEGRNIPIAYASSAQAGLDTPYASSKRAAEERLIAHARDTGAPLAIYRWPNVFGKWGRPNYNSAVATFCHNIARGMPIRIDDPASPLHLVYIDNVRNGAAPFPGGTSAGDRVRRGQACIRHHSRRAGCPDSCFRRGAKVPGDRKGGQRFCTAWHCMQATSAICHPTPSPTQCQDIWIRVAHSLKC